MNHEQIEQLLKKYKSKIKVNEQLKATLWKSLKEQQKRRKQKLWSSFVSLSAVAIFLLSFGIFQLQENESSIVHAASLQIKDKVSMIDINGNNPLTAAQFGQTIYLSFLNKGLFAYDSEGFHKISDRELEEMVISPDGKFLAYSSHGTVGVYNFVTKQWLEVLQKDDTNVYASPAWKANNQLLVVKKQPDRENIQPTIMEINLDNGKIKQIATGLYPSFSEENQLLVYQIGEGSAAQIIVRNLDNGNEYTVDDGQFPSLSPDGDYIAYVKSETNVENIWISDIDANTKRLLTNNTTQAEQDAVENSLFNYSHLSWSNDSLSVLTLEEQLASSSSYRLLRIDLIGDSLGPEEIVLTFERAALRRYDEFAMSLLVNPLDYTSTSNPHRVNFEIIRSGQIGERKYVDVKEVWAYTANPYATTNTLRYFLKEKGRSHLIDEMTELEKETVIGQDPDGYLFYEDSSGTTNLFHIDDIPNEMRPKGDWHLASIAQENSESLLLTLQSIGDSNSPSAAVYLIRYNMAEQQFQFIDTFNEDGKDLIIDHLTVSTDGSFAALNLFSEGKDEVRPYVIVYDLKNNESIDLHDYFVDTSIQAIRSFYWENNHLHFTLESNEQQIQFALDAKNKLLLQP